VATVTAAGPDVQHTVYSRPEELVELKEILDSSAHME
jgi:hypothetical protein